MTGAAPVQRPNDLRYCTHWQRFDTFGALGNPDVHAPNLDWLAPSGLALTRAYCLSPICAPNRARLSTGR